jgi:hypothetical protein
VTDPSPREGGEEERKIFNETRLSLQEIGVNTELHDRGNIAVAVAAPAAAPQTGITQRIENATACASFYQLQKSSLCCVGSNSLGLT